MVLLVLGELAAAKKFHVTSGIDFSPHFLTFELSFQDGYLVLQKSIIMLKIKRGRSIFIPHSMQVPCLMLYCKELTLKEPLNDVVYVNFAFCHHY